MQNHQCDLLKLLSRQENAEALLLPPEPESARLPAQLRHLPHAQPIPLSPCPAERSVDNRDDAEHLRRSALLPPTYMDQAQLPEPALAPQTRLQAVAPAQCVHSVCP